MAQAPGVRRSLAVSGYLGPVCGLAIHAALVAFAAYLTICNRTLLPVAFLLCLSRPAYQLMRSFGRTTPRRQVVRICAGVGLALVLIPFALFKRVGSGRAARRSFKAANGGSGLFLAAATGHRPTHFLGIRPLLRGSDSRQTAGKSGKSSDSPAALSFHLFACHASKFCPNNSYGSVRANLLLRYSICYTGHQTGGCPSCIGMIESVPE
jgi:hypothetical protein